MGVFHLECAASELPIISQPVALVLVIETSEGFVPAALPIHGEYDSYGSIENIEEDGNTGRVLAVFRELAKKRQLSIGARKLDPPETLDDLLGEIRQGQVDDVWMKLGQSSFGFTLVLENVYSAVVRTVERDPTLRDVRRADLARLGTDALVARAFGKLDLSRSLYSKIDGRAADEIVTGLVELVQFRRWFDSRGSWIPDPLGDQYIDDDIPPFIAKAKKALAAWPLLIEAVTDYERDFEAGRDDDDDDDLDEDSATFGIESAFPDEDDEEDDDLQPDSFVGEEMGADEDDDDDDDDRKE